MQNPPQPVGFESRLTLIIPTRNRPRYLKRILSYYKQLKFPFAVFVADSSSSPMCDVNRNIVRAVQEDLSIRYELYNHEIAFYSKNVKAFKAITSEFVVMCADDDFLVPASIQACLLFLENHPDYSAAQGTARFFQLIRDPQSPSESIFKIVGSQTGKTLSHDNPVDRLYQHLDDYRPTFYTIHRRIQILENFEKALESAWDLRFGELLLSSLTVLQGKVKRIDVLYDVRELHDTQSNHSVKTWGELLVAEDFSERYRAFRNCLVNTLESLAGASGHIAEDAIDKSFLAYLGREFSLLIAPNTTQVNQDPRNKKTTSQRIYYFMRRLRVVGGVIDYVEKFAKNQLIKDKSTRALPNYDPDLFIIEQQVLLAENIERFELEVG